MLLSEGALLVRGFQKTATCMVHVLENVVLLHVVLANRRAVARPLPLVLYRVDEASFLSEIVEIHIAFAVRGLEVHGVILLALLLCLVLNRTVNFVFALLKS